VNQLIYQTLNKSVNFLHLDNLTISKSKNRLPHQLVTKRTKIYGKLLLLLLLIFNHVNTNSKLCKQYATTAWMTDNVHKSMASTQQEKCIWPRYDLDL